MKNIQHTCDYCGFYYEEKLPAGHVQDKGMVEISGRNACLDCHDRARMALEKLLFEVYEKKRKHGTK